MKKLSGKVPQEVYEKLEGQYQKKRIAAEARLSQLEVDYGDPLDFLDKCILVASMLLYLHQKFDFEQRKNLSKAIFERIYVQDRAIVGVKLNPPFSFLMKDDLENVFKNPPPGHTKQDIFEQIITFTLSERYTGMKERISLIFSKLKQLSELSKAA